MLPENVVKICYFQDLGLDLVNVGLNLDLQYVALIKLFDSIYHKPCIKSHLNVFLSGIHKLPYY